MWIRSCSGSRTVLLVSTCCSEGEFFSIYTEIHYIGTLVGTASMRAKTKKNASGREADSETDTDTDSQTERCLYTKHILKT